MNEDLDRLFMSPEQPDSAVLKQIHSRMAASAKPVKPLPSNAILCAISLGVFFVVSFVVAAAVGFKAIAALSAGEMTLYYGLVLVFAFLFARALVERMIPGEKRLVSAYALVIVSLTVLGVFLSVMFSNYSMSSFVASGYPCLRLGCISALISGAFGWRLLRRGYLVSPLEAIVLYGFFAGLVGIAVLALHCPIRNSLHVLVWHLGAMVLAGFAGMIIGKVVENRSDAN